MKSSTLALSLFLFGSQLFAAEDQWRVVPAPKGSGTKWFAEIKTQAGHKLILKRKIARAGYEVFAELHLPKGQQFAGSMPKVQIDKDRVEDTSVIKLAGDNLGLRWGFIEDNVAVWRIWQAPRMELTAGDALEAWREGTRLQIQYATKTSRSHRADFSLNGSDQAITQVVSGPFK